MKQGTTTQSGRRTTPYLNQATERSDSKLGKVKIAGLEDANQAESANPLGTVGQRREEIVSLPPLRHSEHAAQAPLIVRRCSERESFPTPPHCSRWMLLLRVPLPASSSQLRRRPDRPTAWRLYEMTDLPRDERRRHGWIPPRR